MRSRLRPGLVAGALLAATSVLGTGGAAHAAPTWLLNGPIHPGVQTVSGGSSQCTANFVFYDSSNNVYIGQAAHCTTLSGATTTNGCQATSMPLNTTVRIGGTNRLGRMVYNSWIAMQLAGEPVNSTQCANNDFAIVKLDALDYGRVDPTIPFWGGPGPVKTGTTGTLTDVYSYGNSSLRLGLTPLSPKQGVKTSGGGWKHNVYTATPGIPGDSGSAFLDETGLALGVLATLSADGSNGVVDLNLALNYLKTHSAYTTLQLATGLTAFSPLV